MNSNNNLLGFFTGVAAADLAKIMTVTVEFMYIFFAFALWRQLSLMTQSIKLGASPFFNLIGVIHLALVIGVFILGFIIL